MWQEKDVEENGKASKSVADIFQQAQPFADLHFWNDTKNQLKAIIAIHDTTLGPALGGCRMLSYISTAAAQSDVLNLARGMTYKSAINQLPFGGGKSVIVQPTTAYDRIKLMQSFGRFVESLGGRYIAAVDSGTSPEDMDIIKQQTNYVTCTSEQGDPSPTTARGVFLGIQACSKFLRGSTNLTGQHIVVQGLGHVGYELIKLLNQAGAKLTVSDVNNKAVLRCEKEFAVNYVHPIDIYNVPCDVFAPCALGQIINHETVHRLKAKAIAGAANNQLSDCEIGPILRQRNILYAPDYVINSGGILHITQKSEGKLSKKLDELYHRLIEIFNQSQLQNLATNLIANAIVDDYIKTRQ